MSGSSGSKISHSRPPQEWVANVFAQLDGPLVAYVSRQLHGDVDAAQDIVQEAFVKLCQQAWPDIELHHRPWLYRTCRNRVIDLSRREGRMSAINSSADIAGMSDRSADSEPVERASQVEQIERLRLRIDDLPPRQQEVLRLRLQEGLSYKQVAEVTGLTATNVGYLLHQAISSLRTSMQAD
jgi:RNA polymerase sigma-70 factor (ECF subfamily)